jgi:tetratricopeptide (TPR) repeat protein
MRTIVALGLVAAMAAAAAAQDTVRLKNGKHLTGTVTLNDSDKEGFQLTRWDSGGTIYVKWTQVPEGEKLRLLNKGMETAVAPTVGDILDGVRIVTASREVVGVITSEDAQQIFVKTAGSASPVPVPKGAILKRDGLKINEIDAYSPDEMVAKRETAAGEGDMGKLLEVGRFAQALKMYAKAKELYEKAAALDESKKSEVEPLIAAVVVLIREDDAQKALAGVKKLAEDTKYPEAIEAADKFLTDFADTECGKANKSLKADLEKEAKEFEANRSKILAAKVPDAWRSIRNSMFGEYSNAGKFKIAEARSNVDKMDAEIAKRVGAKFNCTQDEAEQFWQKREKKAKTVSLNTGSWILLGGQDGGMDFTGDPNAQDGQGQSNNPVDDFVKKFGGNRGGNRGGQQPKKLEWGKPLQTSQQWWETASQSARRDWLEAYYVLNVSALVEKDQPVNKDCPYCKAQGTVKAMRNARSIDVICPRCHGAKYEQSVTYK